ncbi:MAG TPA: hypothetical protein PLZ51_16035, partial [Aggregatilineales bacterium]|nr:hypothetical protein [Aggregatilineales bacterium]
MKHIHITLSAMFIIILAFSFGIHAQTDPFAVYDNELLVYVVEDNNQIQIISQNGDRQAFYTFSSDKCFAVTSDGKYLALYEENGNTIQIIHLNSQTVLSQTTWDNRTFTCGVTWLPKSTILSIRKSLDNLLYYEFYFDGSNLTQRPDYDGNILTTYPQLPYWIPDIFT